MALATRAKGSGKGNRTTRTLKQRTAAQKSFGQIGKLPASAKQKIAAQKVGKLPGTAKQKIAAQKVGKLNGKLPATAKQKHAA